MHFGLRLSRDIDPEEECSNVGRLVDDDTGEESSNETLRGVMLPV